MASPHPWGIKPFKAGDSSKKTLNEEDLKSIIKKGTTASEHRHQHTHKQNSFSQSPDLYNISRHDMDDPPKGPEHAFAQQHMTASPNPNHDGPSTMSSLTENLKGALQEVICDTLGIQHYIAKPSIDRLAQNLSSMMSAIVDDSIRSLNLDARFEAKADSLRKLTFRKISNDWSSYEEVYEILAREVQTYQQLLDAIRDLAVDKKCRLAPIIEVFDLWEPVRPENWDKARRRFHEFDFSVEKTLTVYLAIPKNAPRWANRIATKGYLSMVFPQSTTVAQLKTEIYSMILQKDGRAALPPDSDALLIIPSDTGNSVDAWPNDMPLAQCLNLRDSSVNVSVLAFCSTLSFNGTVTWFGKGNCNVLNRSHEVLNRCACSLVDPKCNAVQCKGTSASRKSMLKLSKEELIAEIINLKAAMDNSNDDCNHSCATYDFDADSRSHRSCESGSAIDELEPAHFRSVESSKIKQNQMSERQQTIHDDDETEAIAWKHLTVDRKAPATTYKRTFAESVASSSDGNPAHGMSGNSSISTTGVHFTPNTPSWESIKAAVQTHTASRYSREYPKRCDHSPSRSVSPYMTHAGSKTAVQLAPGTQESNLYNSGVYAPNQYRPSTASWPQQSYHPQTGYPLTHLEAARYAAPGPNAPAYQTSLAHPTACESPLPPPALRKGVSTLQTRANQHKVYGDLA